MNILLTGGAGFIGSHIAEKYIEKGHNVTVVDNLSVGKKEWVHEEADFIEADITEEDGLDEIFEGKDFNIVNHHAAHNDAMSSLEKPAEDAENNIIGSIKLLEKIRENNIEKVIYASSGGLSYGEPQNLPTTEEHEMKPVYPYGISKHSFEHYLELYRELYGLEFVTLRYGSVYGPRATGGVIMNFLEAIENSEEPVIFGDGSQTRDFVHVKDVVDANLKSLERGSGFYNIGTSREKSINELWKIVSKITSYSKEPRYEDRWLGDIDRCQLDYSKARKELNWSPERNLEKSIKKLWKQEYSG